MRSKTATKRTNPRVPKAAPSQTSARVKKAAQPAKPAAPKPTAPKPTPPKAAPARRRRYKYDVCFSFAGEDRAYVARTRKCLENRGVRVFYDNDEKHRLWGKDLVEHFDTLYQSQARYCVMFISEHYVRKPWTRLERRSALARAFRSKKEYILPVRFDDTPVPGVPKTRAHIDLRTHTPLQLALLIVAKLHEDLPEEQRESITVRPRRPKAAKS